MTGREFYNAYRRAFAAYHSSGQSGYECLMDHFSAESTTEQWSLIEWASENGWPTYTVLKKYGDATQPEP